MYLVLTSVRTPSECRGSLPHSGVLDLSATVVLTTHAALSYSPHRQDLSPITLLIEMPQHLPSSDFFSTFYIKIHVFLSSVVE